MESELCGRSAEALGLAGQAAIGMPPDPGLRITSLASDSREVRKGGLFAALKGGEVDGAAYVGAAIRAGAAAVLASSEGALRARDEIGELRLPVFLDEDPRRRLALVAAQFWAAQPEHVAAVTGTNGKTSSVCFLRSICEAAGHPAASIGTLGVSGPGTEAGLRHTTPDPITLHRILAGAAAAGATHLAVEASSHALVQRRLDGVRIAAAALTNLSRDHYDYHGGCHAYAAAKLRLFSELLAPDGCAVANLDDPIGETALEIARSRGCRTLPVGSGAAAAEGIRLLDGRPVPGGGQWFRFGYAGREWEAELSFAGAFQVTNALLAAGCAIALGIDPEQAFAALAKLAPVRGRMELVARRENGAAVYVDYAHTPDALRAVLTAARQHLGPAGRLHVVVGAGGRRDTGKRAEMGAVAAGLADGVIVTDDNPRDEDPAAIRRALREGAPEAREIGDRGEAIREAVAGLAAADVLVIAGKGHEQMQDLATGAVPFDDAEAARAAVGA